MTLMELFQRFDSAIDQARLERELDSPSGWVDFYSREFSCHAMIEIYVPSASPVIALALKGELPFSFTESSKIKLYPEEQNEKLHKLKIESFRENLKNIAEGEGYFCWKPELGGRELGQLILYRPDGTEFNDAEKAALDLLATRLDSEMDIYAGFLGRHDMERHIDDSLDTFNLMKGIVEAMNNFLKVCSPAANGFVVFRDGVSEDAKVISICFENGRYKGHNCTGPYKFNKGKWTAEIDNIKDYEIRPLIKRAFDGSVIEIGYVGVTRADMPLWVEPVLDSMAWQIDSRIAGYQLMRASLMRFMDSSLVDAAISSKGELDSVLAPKEIEIGMLYADLVGFSTMCKDLLNDPQDALLVVNEWSAHMQELVFKERRGVKGIWDKMVGDCVVALVGPQYDASPETLSMNVVELGREMIEVTRKLHEHLPVLKGHMLDLRVGLNFGKVIAGELGPKVSRDFTALGHEMNLAARIQSAAVPGEVLVSGRIREITKDQINYENSRKVKVKNLGEIEVFPVSD